MMDPVSIPFVPVLVAGALLKKIIDVARYARAGQWGSVALQVGAWVGGFAVIALFAASDWGQSFVVGDLAVANMSLASQVLAGFALGSTASLVTDVIRAVDNTQTAQVPAPPDRR